MADKQPSDPKTTGETAAVPAAPATPPPRRSPGHRGADVRDTVAEMAARAQEISQEAGSRMAAAMKDVINAAAGIADFAIESARDLAQYMVRRGQMTQEEADKLIREAEAAQAGRPPTARAKTPAASGAVSPTPRTAAAIAAAPTPVHTPAMKTPAAPRPAVPPPAVAKKAAPPKAAAKPAGKKAVKAGAKAGKAKPAAKKSAAKKPKKR
jgi:polyhydroxyalkanoate synthesis regulator phasin